MQFSSYSQLQDPILLTSATPCASTIVSGIAHVHAHCILHDATLATFLPPLSSTKLHKYWIERLQQVEQGSRHIIVQLRPETSRTAEPNEVADIVFAADSLEAVSVPTVAIEIAGEIRNFEVAGFVSLYKPESETGPFRADVEKLLVSPNHRRQGVAKALMQVLERTALEDGRWNLLLDTTVGSDAEFVYPRLGYERMGTVKNYGFDVRKWMNAGCQGEKEFVDELWFNKNLKTAGEL